MRENKSNVFETKIPKNIFWPRKNKKDDFEIETNE